MRASGCGKLLPVFLLHSFEEYRSKGHKINMNVVPRSTMNTNGGTEN